MSKFIDQLALFFKKSSRIEDEAKSMSEFSQENPENKISKKQILSIVGILFLMAGLALSVYFIQKQQIFKSRAAVNSINAFEIKDANGNIIQCDGSTNPPSCTTNTLDLKIRIKDTSPLLPLP